MKRFYLLLCIVLFVVIMGCASAKPIVFDASISAVDQAQLEVDTYCRIIKFDDTRVNWPEGTIVNIPSGRHTIVSEYVRNTQREDFSSKIIKTAGGLELSYEFLPCRYYHLNISEYEEFAKASIIANGDVTEYAVPGGNETLIIFHQKKKTFWNRFCIFLNGEKMFFLEENRDKRIIIPNGKHEIYVTRDLNNMVDGKKTEIDTASKPLMYFIEYKDNEILITITELDENV